MVSGVDGVYYFEVSPNEPVTQVTKRVKYLLKGLRAAKKPTLKGTM